MFERSFLAHFFQNFMRVAWYLRSLYVVLIGLILAGGLAVAAMEKLSIGEAIYFAFITGLTVGYGDLVPHTGTGRFISVLLGLVGVVFTGLVVAGATHAVQKAWAEMHGSE